MFKKVFLIITIFFLATPQSTRATINLYDEFKLNETETVISVFRKPGNLVSTILSNVLILSSIILFFIFLLGGYTIISSQGNPEKTEKGKQSITSAIIGFVIIFTSYWIIQIIEIVSGITIL